MKNHKNTRMSNLEHHYGIVGTPLAEQEPQIYVAANKTK